MTVLGTYRYTYVVPITRGATLEFSAAKPLSVGISALGFVDAAVNGKSVRLFAAELQPADSDGLHWHAVRVSLDRYAGKLVALTFGADVVQGNAIGTWVSFANAGIYDTEKQGGKQ
ncbi:MAG: hypothetical protein WAN59_00820 [Candidatus Baltobacteraceae bacterium]